MSGAMTSPRVVGFGERGMTRFSRDEMLLLKLVLVLIQFCAATPSQTVSHRYQVLRLHAGSDAELHVIRQLQGSYNLDPWREVGRVNSSGDYLVPPLHLQDVQGQLEKNGIQHHVLIEDADRFFQENNPLRSRRRMRRSAPAHDFRHKFLSYTELRHFLNRVRKTATKAKVEMDSSGRSFEGRPTPYVKISSLNDSTPKWTIFIDGGIHGREWISPALTVEIIHRLAFNTENDSDTDNLLRMFDWIIVPLVNPDGYSYTFTSGFENRLWRKSRSTSYSQDSHCYGVDLNRNFGFQWNNSPLHGGSSNPCSSTFSGPRSFSEPESRNLRNLLLGNSDTIKAYLSFHSFGQFFLYPWGYSSDVSIEDEEDLLHVASAFSKTMMAKNYDYSVGGSAKVLYPAAGGSDDYVRGTVGVKYAYTVELPPHETSRYGFLLPETLVQSVVTDTWDGLKAFAIRLYKHLQSKSHGRTVKEADRPNVANFILPSTSGYHHDPSPASPEVENSYTAHGTDSFRNSYTAHGADRFRNRTKSKRNKKKLQQIQYKAVPYLVQSLLTRRPIWFSLPRTPSYSHRESSKNDIVNTFIRRMSKITA